MNRRKLAADHLWIARYHAKRLSGTLDYWELLSIGHVALMEAAKRWPGKQAFVPYATTRIIQRMQNAIRDSQGVTRKAQKTNTLDEIDTPEPDGECVYYVRDWIDQLPPDEQRAVRMAYGIGMRTRTMSEIAKSLKFGLTTTGKILQSGLLRLRYMATCEMVNGA